MPYFITDKGKDCSGWATVKADGEVIGCHATKAGAIKQMVAVSLAEKIKPGGERALNNELEVGDWVFWDNAGHTEYGLITFISTYGVVVDQLGATPVATQDAPLAKISVYDMVIDRLVGTDRFVVKPFAPLSKLEMPHDNSDHQEDMQHDENLNRAINQDAPAYMRAAARRGLQYVEEGKGGDGLKQQTINEARKMASGEVSDDKWVRIAAWIARHLGDLDSPEADPQHPNYPSAGVVAHLLWGSGPSKTKARAAMNYAEGVVERIRNEERHLPGKHDQSTHGKGGGTSGLTAKQQAERVYAKGSAAEPVITKQMTDLAAANGGEMIGLEFRLKEVDSLTRKIEDKARDEFGGDYKAAADDIGDSVRYTMQLNEGNYSSGVKNTVETLNAEGYKTKTKNYWQEGNIYKGVNVTVTSPAGQKFELQFHTKSSHTLKETKNHKLYEEHRLSTTSKARKSELEREMADNWLNVKVPTNLGLISTVAIPVLQLPS